MIIYEENSKELVIPMGLGTPSGGTVEEYVGGKNIDINGNVINCTIDTSAFVTEDELDGYATEAVVDEKIENSLTGYATEEYVQQQVIEAGSVTTDIVEEMIDESLVDYYTQDEIDAVLDDYYTKTQVDSKINTQQFKTINNQSIKGSGNFSVVENINGVSGIWQGTKAQYDALPSHSNNVVYIIKG